MIKNVKNQVNRRIKTEAKIFLVSLRIENVGNSKKVTLRVKTIFSMGIFFLEKHNVKIVLSVFTGENYT